MSVDESFDQVIPGAVAHQDAFLGVIQKRCNEAQIGIHMEPQQPDRKQKRIVMIGTITFGNGWSGKSTYALRAYADPLGPALQVGWQLISPDVRQSAMGPLTNAGSFMQNNAIVTQNRIAGDPEVVRQLSGIVQGFHQMVFLPTLQDLISACAPARPANGFMGAQ
jgi:hypothetical protein